MLEIKHITQSFGKNTVLDDLTLTIEQGEIVGLVAPNGTGKTTLLNIIMNFLKPDEGEVTFKGKLNYSTKRKEVKMHRQLSFLPEIDDLYQELSGKEHISYYARLWKKSTKEVDAIIDRLGMAYYVKNSVRTYSLGMRQRLCFAMILAADTEVMLMDEVMNGLDPDNVDLLTRELIQLKAQGKIIIIASHLLSNLDLYSDRVLFLKDGQVALEKTQGTKDETLYIKVPATEKQVEALKEVRWFPEKTRHFSKSLLCVPTEKMCPEEVGEWISYFYKQGHTQATIGPIGSSEWYSELYHK